MKLDTCIKFMWTHLSANVWIHYIIIADLSVITSIILFSISNCKQTNLLSSHIGLKKADLAESFPEE